MAAERPLVWLERGLLLFGCACITYFGYITIEARQFRHQQTAAFDAHLARGETGETGGVGAAGAGGTGAGAAGGSAPAAPDPPNTPATAPALKLAPGVMGILDIPRLRISSPVMSGDDDKTLDVAIGHLPDTPKPWEKGNSAVAAHRDGLFRPLRDIKVGDDLRLRTVHGELLYRVRELKIVMPEDISVLDPTPTDILTLITCFPFDFVGAAPQRFIVHAERIR